MKYKLPIGMMLSVMLLNAQTGVAHNEWVHQYIIREAYKFLEAEVGEIPSLKPFVGLDFHGNPADALGDGWRLPLFHQSALSVGAWREDVNDLVFDRGDWFNGWNASATHFWNPDLGLETDAFIVTGFVENAWKKAKWLAFGRSENAAARLKVPLDGNSLFRWDVVDGNVVIVDFARTVGYMYAYPSLESVFLNDENSLGGVYRISGYLDVSGTWQNISPDAAGYNWFDPCMGVCKPPSVETQLFRKRAFSYYVLGQIAHLLADQSVPAHTHGDTHPCPYPFSQGDYYETWVSNNRFNPCAEEQTEFPADDFTAETARKQGGLLYEVFSFPTKKESLQYLFYTMNQLANRWGSGDRDENVNELDGNHVLESGTNNYLDFRYANLPDERAVVLHLNGLETQPELSHLADETLNFCIRATATLMYWYAINTNQIDCPTNLALQNQAITGINQTLNARYEAASSIVAGAAPFTVQPITSGVEVLSDAVVTFTAGDFIRLTPGFTVSQGADFTARIDNIPCEIIKKTSAPPPGGRGASRTQSLGLYDTLHNVVISLPDSVDYAIGDTTVLPTFKSFTGVNYNVSRRDTFVTIITDSITIVDFDSTVHYLYHLSKIDISYSGIVTIIRLDSISPTAQSWSVSKKLIASPNPLKGVSSVSYSLPESAECSLTLYDVLGRQVRRLIDKRVFAVGNHTYDLDVTGLSPGWYVVTLLAGHRKESVRILVL